MNNYNILTVAEFEAINAVMRGAGLPRQKTLVVEDDDVTREMLADILQVNDIQCLTAKDAAEALTLLDNDMSIGLVITDLRMQPLNGLALIRKIRKSKWADLPIVIISGDAEVRDAIAAMHLNVVDFLLKPIDPDHLVALVYRELDIQV